ncbi:MAG: pseudouridine-5'-phosphate glycosidase [Anaerolineales bacterium]|nr:pseudouridine-5'-phosphate glycosidase [Anaerolineales bacterium]
MTIQPEIQLALKSGRPVVALETTVITHGLPVPVNFELANQMEDETRAAGAVPATIAVLNGELKVGLTQNELEFLATAEGIHKAGKRDLGVLCSRNLSAGTTVSATMFIAHHAGIRVFATGGIGGVHRGGSGDISADLPELGQTPVAVVCSGAKAILDLPRTMEWLETAGVPVLGWQTDTFPAFFSVSSNLPVHTRVDNAQEAASILHHHWQMGLKGALVTVPCPDAEAVESNQVEVVLKQAEKEAQKNHITGKAVTPFLLSRLAELTEGQTMKANLALLLQNARTAAQIASALQTL